MIKPSSESRELSFDDLETVTGGDVRGMLAAGYVACQDKGLGPVVI